MIYEYLNFKKIEEGTLAMHQTLGGTNSFGLLKKKRKVRNYTLFSEEEFAGKIKSN